ncbi:MAG: hypothetical protein HDS43_03050 [Bacteroides sp.]|nr:hypothetical protein [Bacteroides sp.]
MKKFLSYTQTTLSLIAIILSIVAISVTYPRSADSGLDYIGIIVGILGVLVAILIGWQLYNALNLQELVSQTEKAKVDAIEAKNQAEQMLKDTQVSTTQLSSNLSSITNEVTHLSNCNRSNIEHISTITKEITDLQSIVRDSMDSYNSMQSYLEKLNEELANKINKDEIQYATEEDAKKMVNDIFGNNRAES